MDFDDIELTYGVHDGGERIVFVHAAPFVSWYGPLGNGWASSRRSRTDEDRACPRRGRYRPLTVAEDAAICRRLMDHVGWSTRTSWATPTEPWWRSSLPSRESATGRLRSPVEPAARGVSSSAAVAAAREPVFAAYASGDTAGALDAFLRHVCGEDYRPALESRIPDAFDEAFGEADLFFQSEMMAVKDWRVRIRRGRACHPAGAQRARGTPVQRFRRWGRTVAVAGSHTPSGSLCRAPDTC